MILFKKLQSANKEVKNITNVLEKVEKRAKKELLKKERKCKQTENKFAKSLK